MAKARVVLDTNVFVSGLMFPGRTPELAIRRALTDASVLASAATLDELRTVLARPKLAAYLPEEERRLFFRRLVDAVELIVPEEHIAVCRDPKDDKFLELAAAGKADFIVSGDADLRVLGRFRGTLIVSPAELLEMLPV